LHNLIPDRILLSKHGYHFAVSCRVSQLSF
jgi:hypothetical protein